MTQTEINNKLQNLYAQRNEINERLLDGAIAVETARQAEQFDIANDYEESWLELFQEVKQLDEEIEFLENGSKLAA